MKKLFFLFFILFFGVNLFAQEEEEILPPNWQWNGNDIYYVGGKVGIGTSSPTDQLTVVGTTYLGGKITIPANTRLSLYGAGTSFISFHTAYRPNYPNLRMATGNEGTVYDTTNGIEYTAIGSNQWRPIGTGIRLHGSYSQMGFYVRNTITDSYILVAQSTGNVGIGTINPTKTLSVNGDILGKSLTISVNSTDWPDFVFDKNYKLKELSEVKSFVEENKHLPDMPSKEDIEKDQLNVGEMSTKLLQKVEELTLYVIKQNEEIENLKKEVSNLKK